MEAPSRHTGPLGATGDIGCLRMTTVDKDDGVSSACKSWRRSGNDEQIPRRSLQSLTG